MSLGTVAMLTAGGLAPCLSSAVGGLIEQYTARDPGVRIIGYQDGYAGLLRGRSTEVSDEVRAGAGRLHELGGSPLGSSRVKLTNSADLERRGLIGPGEDPLQVAAEQLRRDGVDVLHTIGGDDTSTTAADLARYLAEHGHDLRVVGLPKTIDNDIVPVARSLGAATAAAEGARFARNVVAEHSANPRMLIVHEIMGRRSGWLTAATTARYREELATRAFLPGIGADPRRWDVHAVYVPEQRFDLDAEADRLRAVMDELGCATIFLSEGAGVDEIVAAMEADGETVPRDPFGHVQIDKINPGAWLAGRFVDRVGAEKVMVQKSGYFVRSAAPQAEDRALIDACVDLAVRTALEGGAGLVGHDEERGGELRAIELERVTGGRRFDPEAGWFADLQQEIGQA
ncbi:pyrophosphate--fructose-6-phosphate 1-phosphotransferase [Janibacter alkaliphilus]|uniref:Pyrophosphate--fructose-6-phosphate 1-phosphotransferase n=1 Tax=Janibacter alkaliphilus TaxID=1069963 RepID=A0A852X0N8_9MICO|nr:pyrophosphate--fructose-6-phosphate 1-phosphotransferase [Janibacter alkaliphilus]